MKEKLEEALKKEHSSLAYALEIGAGAVAIWADDIVTNLGGVALGVDGIRRIMNITNYYKSTIRDYLRNSQD